MFSSIPGRTLVHGRRVFCVCYPHTQVHQQERTVYEILPPNPTLYTAASDVFQRTELLHPGLTLKTTKNKKKCVHSKGLL